jgi:hypothetical protein
MLAIVTQGSLPGSLVNNQNMNNVNTVVITLTRTRTVKMDLFDGFLTRISG